MQAIISTARREFMLESASCHESASDTVAPSEKNSSTQVEWFAQTPSVVSRLDRIDRKIEQLQLLPDIERELRRMSLALNGLVTRSFEANTPPLGCCDLRSALSLDTNAKWPPSDVQTFHSPIRSSGFAVSLDYRRPLPETPPPRHILPDDPVEEPQRLMVGVSSVTSVDQSTCFRTLSSSTSNNHGVGSTGFASLHGSNSKHTTSSKPLPPHLENLMLEDSHCNNSLDTRDNKTSTSTGTNQQLRRVTGIYSRASCASSRMSAKMSAMTQGIIKGKQSAHAQKVWIFIEDEDSSVQAWYFGRIVTLLLLVSVGTVLLQTTKETSINDTWSMAIDTSFEVCFAFEVILRFAVCPTRCGFFRNVFNLIDIAAAAPLVLRFSVSFKLPAEENFVRLCLLCGVPILRLLKILRRFEKFLLLLDAFNLAFEALPVLLFTLSLISMVFTSLLYVVEPRDNIETWPHAWWLVLVTMTTVGYGDVTPKSTSGSIVVAVLVVVSVLYMAMPLGIIGNAFTRIWKERDRILLIKKTRDVLLEWGYTAHDIPTLFDLFSPDGQGELKYTEFRRLIRKMGIGLQEDRIAAIFEVFDADGSGAVDAEEFVKALFPVEYPLIYGEATTATNRKTRLSAVLALKTPSLD